MSLPPIGLLTVVTFLPAVGALLILLLVPRRHEEALRWGGLVVSLATFAASVPLWTGFDAGDADMQFEELLRWMPGLGVGYHVGVDGISVLLVLLTTFLMPVALASAWHAIEDRTKEFVIAMLLLEVGMVGVFVSLDLFLFFVFWEAMLIPMYFVIGVWGGANRVYAAVKFVLYTMVGSALMLVAILALYYQHGAATGTYTFDLPTLTRYVLAPGLAQNLMFVAFALAFAIKVPLFPFHTWLPDAHVEAPTAGSVILAGVLLKMGTYGFLRFCLPLFPDASVDFGPWVYALAVIGIVYGAFVSTVLPGLNGFVGEFLILVGTFSVNKWLAAVATTGIIFAAVYLLWMYQRVAFGEIRHEANRRLADLTPREWAVLVPVLVLIVWIGVYPKAFTAKTEASVLALIAQVESKAAVAP